MKRLLILFLLSTAGAFAHDVVLNWVWAQGTGDPATSFNVKRGTTTGGPYAVIATVSCAPGQNCAAAIMNYTYTDNTVVAGQTYFYVTTAVSTGGESGPSNETSQKIPISPPNSPQTLTSTSQ